MLCSLSFPETIFGGHHCAAGCHIAGERILDALALAAVAKGNVQATNISMGGCNIRKVSNTWTGKSRMGWTPPLQKCNRTM